MNLPDSAPPHSVEVEQALLACLLTHRPSIASVRGKVKPSDFYRPAHQAICRRIFESFARDMPADAFELSARLAPEELEEFGGRLYLMDLASNAPMVTFAPKYAEVVAGFALLREIIRRSDDIKVRAWESDPDDAVQVRDEAVRLLNTLEVASQESIATAADMANWFWEEDAKPPAPKVERGIIPTGYHDVDYLLTGFKPGQLIVVGGRPAMGKTSWVLNVARNVFWESEVLIFSLEMSKEDLFNRWVSDLADVDIKHVEDRALRTEAEQVEIDRVTNELYKAKYVIQDDRKMTVADMARTAHRMKAQGKKPAMIIVDYLSLITSTPTGRGGEQNRNLELGRICKELRALGKDLGCPVVTLAQLSRAVESREDKRPMMSDLRDSGEVEQDADIIIFLYRDDYYAKQEKRPSKKPGMAEVLIAKHRGGPTGSVDLRFEETRTRFSDYYGSYGP